MQKQGREYSPRLLSIDFSKDNRFMEITGTQMAP
jgi:hypothetical protein